MSVTVVVVLLSESPPPGLVPCAGATGKHINFEGVSGPLAACYCYAVCPNGVSVGQDCLSNGDGGLICTSVRNTAGTSAALMCMPPGAAWQNLCRGS